MRLTYDKNGNITTLNRNTNISNIAHEIDDLTYEYQGNQLLKVSDNSGDPSGFKDGTNTGNDFSYDSFGNIKQDLNKDISEITYNHLNLPVEIAFSNGGKINYIYDATGSRKSKKVQPVEGEVVTTDYQGEFQYENGNLQFISHAEGYIKPKGNGQFMYAYQYKDHLGNIRLSYADVNDNGVIEAATEILEENNYYPFGLKHQGYNEIANSYRNEAAEKYKYGGKEWNEELGLNLYDFHARNYDPAIGRWLNVDPLAEQTMEPYSYTGNNPIMFTDPTGMIKWPILEKFKGFGRSHLNNYGERRKRKDGTYRTHNGLDINHTGGGNTDLGAPILSTHTGKVTRIAKIEDGDKNAGGTRIVITSEGGVVSTSYMHLDTIDPDLKLGSEVKEGQQIGTMGGSGFGEKLKYTSHLHYEIRVNGDLINPVDNNGDLIDPQLIINKNTNQDSNNNNLNDNNNSERWLLENSKAYSPDYVKKRLEELK